jgi:hypothetical protein
MQNKSSSFGSNGSQQQSASSSVASGKLFPFKQDQNNFESSFNAFQLDSSVIDEEVNSALKELKLDHPEMDFAFNRIGSSHSRANSVDSSTSGFHSNGGGGGGGGGIVGGGYTVESPLKHNFKKDVAKGRNSPITVGSIKTLTTKSVTVESSVDSTTNQNHNQHIVVTSHRINNHAARPIPSGTATFSSLGNNNKPINQRNGRFNHSPWPRSSSSGTIAIAACTDLIPRRPLRTFACSCARRFARENTAATEAREPSPRPARPTTGFLPLPRFVMDSCASGDY